MTTLQLINLVVSLAFLFFVGKWTARSATLMNTLGFTYVVCCCAGLSLADLFPDLINTSLVTPMGTQKAIIASLICQLIFFTAAGWQALRQSGTALTETFSVYEISAKSLFRIRLVVIIGFVFSAVIIFIWFFEFGMYRYFMKGFAFGESGAYYLYRADIQEDVLSIQGQGSYLAKRIMLNLGPLIMVYSALIFRITRNRIFIFLIAAQAVLGVLVAGVYSHKSSMTIALMAPFICYFAWSIKHVSWKVMLAFGLFLTAIFGLSYYLTTGDSNLLEGIFRRAVLVPAYVSSFYFDVFPDVHGFRGVLDILYMPTRASALSSDIAIHDVGQIITGKAYGANASFIAVAYSGMGMWGVVLMAVLLCGVLSILDQRLVTHLPQRVRLVCIISNVTGLMAIVSGSLGAALLNGYLLFPIISLFLVKQTRGAFRAGHNSEDEGFNPL